MSRTERENGMSDGGRCTEACAQTTWSRKIPPEKAPLTGRLGPRSHLVGVGGAPTRLACWRLSANRPGAAEGRRA